MNRHDWNTHREYGFRMLAQHSKNFLVYYLIFSQLEVEEFFDSIKR